MRAGQSWPDSTNGSDYVTKRNRSEAVPYLLAPYRHASAPPSSPPYSQYRPFTVVID